MTVSVLGIRHHGPGSARGVVAELDRLAPDVVLIEGPPEADDLVGWVTQVKPPVALLAYAVDEPRLSAFWPFAVFSPEWQAMTWAVDHSVPVRFCDLPAATSLALLAEQRAADEAETEAESHVGDCDESVPETPAEEWVRTDPIALLARTAGYDDPERWWDDMVESRSESSTFEAITEAMTELRAVPEARGRRSPADEREEQLREAYMRRVLRATTKEFDNVAVVCGAWHTPALTGDLPTVSADNAALKGLPKRKTALAWVPWTHSRLAYAAGYAAGVISPGWYAHLFDHGDHLLERWFTKVAIRLRDQDIAVSSAHVIEAVRLADTLGALRGRPLPGLAEVTDATRSVICSGDEAVMSLVHADVVLGEALGSVPDTAPMTPLEADLRAIAKRLRLPIALSPKDYVLDLRKPNDLARSHLFHRLTLIGIGWGAPDRVSGKGTFKEGWSVAWRPEYAVDVAVASAWGTTVVAAATNNAIRSCATSADLAGITRIVRAALTADLPDALDPALRTLQDRAALDLDVAELMAAVPELTSTIRYGDVRNTDTGSLVTVAHSLLVRIHAGLPSALTGLSDEAAAELRPLIDGVHNATALLGEDERTAWLDVLSRLADRSDINPALLGRITRLLLDTARIDAGEAARRLRLVLSYGTAVAEKASWVEGFLAGEADLLVYHDDLLRAFDDWFAEMPAETFTDTLPLLRRSFGGLPPGVRRAIAGTVRKLTRKGSDQRTSEAAGQDTDAGLDLDRARPAVASVAMLLGIGGER